MARRPRHSPGRHLGKLPPRYLFALNSHADYRATRCPNCSRVAHARKFVLFIHIDPDHLIALGKACRYCAACELIVAHQNEIDFGDAPLRRRFQGLS